MVGVVGIDLLWYFPNVRRAIVFSLLLDHSSLERRESPTQVLLGVTVKSTLRSKVNVNLVIPFAIPLRANPRRAEPTLLVVSSWRRIER